MVKSKTTLFLFSGKNSSMKKISLSVKTIYISVVSLIVLFMALVILLSIVFSNLLVQQKINSLSRQNKLWKSKIIGYRASLDTLYQRLQNYQDNLQYFELAAGTGKQENKQYPLKRNIPEYMSADGLTLKDDVFERVNYLELFAKDILRRQKIVKKQSEELIKEYASIPALLPVEGRITSAFGKRSNPFNIGGPSLEMHEGMDIRKNKGAPIRATADGVVKFAGWSGAYGKLVIIDHQNGYYTYYAHASELKVKKNQKVKRYDIIALVGSTGRSTASHVHYEVRKNAQPINPKNTIVDCAWG
ncbi:MAG: M23 family metallopeptidase [bacterium]